MPKIKSDDLLAKYIFRIGEIRADGSPRPGTLKPREGDMLSTFEVTSLSHSNTCAHGHEYADNPAKNRVHIGFVEFIQSSVSNLGLETIYDNVPPRHVSIKFPDEPEKRREMAKALATKVIMLDKDSSKKYFAACD